jgi:hypothetical protein
MFQIITIIIVIISAILSFTGHSGWAWLFLSILDAIIGSQFWFAKTNYKALTNHTFTDDARFLYERYPHYFAMPFACKDFSASAATSQFGGVLIAIIGCFNGFCGR